MGNNQASGKLEKLAKKEQRFSIAVVAMMVLLIAVLFALLMLCAMQRIGLLMMLLLMLFSTVVLMGMRDVIRAQGLKVRKTFVEEGTAPLREKGDFTDIEYDPDCRIDEELLRTSGLFEYEVYEQGANLFSARYRGHEVTCGNIVLKDNTPTKFGEKSRLWNNAGAGFLMVFEVSNVLPVSGFLWEQKVSPNLARELHTGCERIDSGFTAKKAVAFNEMDPAFWEAIADAVEDVEESMAFSFRSSKVFLMRFYHDAFYDAQRDVLPAEERCAYLHHEIDLLQKICENLYRVI